MRTPLAIIFFSVFFIILDLYIFQAIKVTTRSLFPKWKRPIYFVYWGIALLSVLGLLIYNYAIPHIIPNKYRAFIVVSLFMIYLSKLFGSIILLLEDIYRGIKWIIMRLVKIKRQPETPSSNDHKISRSEFISKATLIATSIPLTTFGYGIVSGAHNYRLHKKTIYLPNLPSAFDGIRIGQISDIHSGSFFDKKEVKRGIQMFIDQKADMIFFTGDLVNNETSEIYGYKDIFSKIKAPLGVYSTLGNHDYGTYRKWPSEAAERKNFTDILKVHEEMGWDLLMNENRKVKINGEEIAVIGVENWGKGRFSKHGDLKKAYQGAEEMPVKLLLSHDPSHWDAQVRPLFSDIDITFAGHTHGFQFGVEIGNIKWSPSQYMYEQWADLYQKKNQYLYVNRGFGFIGYPGRIGIFPEITIITLKRGLPA